MANDRSWPSSLDPASVHVVAGPVHGSTLVDATTGEITYTPHQNFFGTDRFSYQICDNRQKCASAEVAVAVAPVNDRPAANDDAAATNEDTPVTLDVASNDTDVEGEQLTVVEVRGTSEQGGTAAIEGGSVRYAPPANFFGTDVFSYSVSDGGALSATATVTVNIRPVNDAPTFIIGESQSIDEDAGLRMVEWAREISPGPANERQQSLAFEVTTTNPELFAEQPAIGSRGTLTYRPAPDAFGEATVTVILRDGGGTSDGGVDSTDPQTFVITVRPVNDSPTAGVDTATTNEDTPVTIDVLANDHDIDPGDKLAVTGVSPKSAKKGSVALDSAGKTVTYRPYRNFFDEDSFSYTVGDGNGGEAIGTVRVTVKEVNDKPIVKDDSAVTDEDVPVTVNVLGNDGDSDDGIVPASVHVIAAPANGTATVDRATGKIAYAPKDNYSGPDSLRYEVCDRSNACSQANVAITVKPVNDRPTVVDDTASTAEDRFVTIDVLRNDSDVDGKINPASLKVVGGPQHGEAVAAEGRIRYTPAPNYNGDDRFSYQVCDDGGACTEAAVGVTVTPVNDDPTAVDDATTTREGVPVEIDVLANDTDPDNNINRRTARVSRRAANGWAAVNSTTGIFVYAPGPNFVGTDRFSYRVCYSGTPVRCAEASVTVTVTANRAPPAPRPIAPIDINLVGYCKTGYTLEWTPVSDEDGIRRYEWELWYSMDAQTYTRVQEGNTTTNKDTITQICKGGFYRWRVRAVDNSGKVGKFSGYASFAVDDKT